MEQPSLLIDLIHDLDWLYSAAPLMSTPEGIDCFQATLHRASMSISTLNAYPTPPAYRLGRQFEDTVAALLLNSPKCRQLLRNVVITQDKKTLGELDCLYQDQAGDWTHLEMAIKFYLQTTPSDDLAAFVGPGGRDRLDKKWQRLISHQLPLAYQAAALASFDAQGMTAPTHQTLLLTGILFYPFEQWQQGNLLLPRGCDPTHQKGWWLHQHQLDLLEPTADQFDYVCVPRWHWIGGIRHPHKRLTWTELRQQVCSSDAPCMVIRCKDNQEESRGVVVSNHWPNAEPCKNPPS